MPIHSLRLSLSAAQYFLYVVMLSLCDFHVRHAQSQPIGPGPGPGPAPVLPPGPQGPPAGPPGPQGPSGATCNGATAGALIQDCAQECCGSPKCNCDPTCTAAACPTTYISTSCQYTQCVTGAIASSSCQDDINFSSMYVSLLQNVTYCANIRSTYGCTLQQFGFAQACMYGNTCWMSPSTSCNSDCFAFVVNCLTQQSCGTPLASHLCSLVTSGYCSDAVTQQTTCNEANNILSGTPTTAPSSSSSSESVFIVVGVVCVLIAFAFLCGVLVMCRKANSGDVDTTDTSEGLRPPDAMEEKLDPESSVKVNAVPDSPMADSLRSSSKIKHQLTRGQWQKGKVLGRGATGNVHICVLDDGSLIAMKQMDVSSQTEEEIEKHTKELLLVSNLAHSNVVRYFYAARDDLHGCVNIFMEFVQGGSLGQLVRRLDEPLHELVVRRYTKQILSGIAYLHENGIMHRDIKSDNVLLHDAGIVKIADFGSAKKLSPTDPVTSTIIGSPYWMAPEVIVPSPSYSYKADIWSLGITVCELLDNGRVPYPVFDSYWEAVWAIGHGTIVPALPANISSDASDFLLRCLQRDPTLRSDAVELLSHGWINDMGSPRSGASPTEGVEMVTPVKTAPTMTLQDGTDGAEVVQL